MPIGNDGTAQTTAPVFIHKHSTYRDAVITPRATAQDQSLSWGARGLLVYMLSLPADWRLNEAHLIGQSPVGRDGLRSLVRELEAHGYLKRQAIRGERGRVVRSLWHVYDLPQTALPSTENPSAVETQSEPAELPLTENPSVVPPLTASPATALPSTENPSGYKENIHTKQRVNKQIHLCNDDPSGPSLPLALASQESDQDQQPIPALPSDQASNRKPSTTTALPACAEPHRELVTAWWRQRCAAHPTAARTLDAASITAIEHADACGVLLPFLQQAAVEVPKSLGHQYRKRVAALMAPSTDGFDAFKAAYLAARKRATNQSISKAITEYGRIMATGITPDQLLAALRANIRAQHEAEAHGGFAACLPDMARWLKGGLWEAYAPQQGASGASAVSFPPLPARRVSEGPLDDPFAHARELEARRLAAAGQRTTATAS